MQDILTAIGTLNTYGWLAVTVFVVAGFLSGVVLTRGHHKEVINAYQQALSGRDERIKEQQAEIVRLQQALVITQNQATRATAATASVIENTRGGL
jgi:hypothetical protein